ncbi:MAG TPA: GNAT family N-acetyltransferase [Candidatus Limnocylindrales bacterium]|nr:GNAT family N-acetyltransferase [Candidatus Limnocylindrales bacterium]
MTAFRFRRPREEDHPRVLDVAPDWWADRRVRPRVRRVWFRHFTSCSWLAETPEGRLAGVLIGFVSPDDPSVGVIQLLGVSPNHRRSGLGRELIARFEADVASLGVRRLEAAVWPDDRIAVTFLRALGFRPDDGPGTQPLYGTPAYADYEGPGEDVAILVRDLA